MTRSAPAVAAEIRLRIALRSGDSEELLREYARSRDPQLREQLVRRFGPYVRLAARRFTPAGGNTREDLLQVAYMGLLYALDRFDPARGLQFSTFALPVIRGTIQHYLRDTGWLVKVPRLLQELAVRLPKLRAGLERELGRVPTVGEVAAAAGVSEERLLQAMEAELFCQLSSLDRLQDSGDGDEMTLAEVVGTSDPRLAQVEHREWVRAALNNLTRRERTVLEERFFNGRTQAQVAQQVGVSQMHVSRLERQALRKLKTFLFPRESV